MHEQWARLNPVLRAALVAVPALFVVIVIAVSRPAGITAAVMVVGVSAVSVLFVKNRTDRHNAGVERGEVKVVDDPHFRAVDRADLPPDLLVRLAGVGYPASEIGRVVRFDQGWIVNRNNPRDVSAVVGDDGGWARFDPRTVTDLWAVAEYRAGRGRETEG